MSRVAANLPGRLNSTMSLGLATWPAPGRYSLGGT